MSNTNPTTIDERLKDPTDSIHRELEAAYRKIVEEEKTSQNCKRMEIVIPVEFPCGSLGTAVFMYSYMFDEDGKRIENKAVVEDSILAIQMTTMESMSAVAVPMPEFDDDGRRVYQGRTLESRLEEYRV